MSLSESQSEDVDPAYRSKVDRLETRVKELETLKDVSQVIAAPEVKRTMDLKGLLQTLGSIATLLIFVGGIMWWAHSELTRIRDRMDNIDKRMARLETAIRILSVAQGGNTKELVDEALKVAQAKSASGNTESASRILAIANRLIAQDKVKKVPADAKFFAESITKYRNIRVSSHGVGPVADEAFKGTVELAEYRSALTTPPPDFHPEHEYRGVEGSFIGSMEHVNGFTVLTDSAFYGPSAIQIGRETGFLIDGFKLENVLLDGAIIRYHGGPVILSNVWFVNCTFIVQQSQTGAQFLEVAALGEPSAKIG